MKLLVLALVLTMTLKGQQSSGAHMHKNVLGGGLEMCSDSPMTGFLRTGMCETDENDHGLHLVCAQVDEDFLDYTRRQGNDLSTPSGHFPGLKPGNYWCLCVMRWAQAYRAGHAPPVYLAGTHVRAIDHLNSINLGLNNLSESQAPAPRNLPASQSVTLNGAASSNF